MKRIVCSVLVAWPDAVAERRCLFRIRQASARDREQLIHAETTNTDFVAHGERLARLCDTFGPRFSGSTNLESAIDWILDEMRNDGLDNVHGEGVSVPHWVRGEESAGNA